VIEIISSKNEDKTFVGLVERILYTGISLTEPKDVFITKVDHWFDFKWREFSHKIFGALGVWRNTLRIPPFIPDRIVEESYFGKIGKEYIRKDLYRLHIYQSSSENAERKIKRKSAIYLWYSGDTANKTQGSLMVYTFCKDSQNSWYASFIKKKDWQIFKTDNISKAEINAMLDKDYLALIR
jgi:hypothetical protein